MGTLAYVVGRCARIGLAVKTAGTITWLFGRNYIWTLSDRGNLELISVEQMNAAVAEVREALRAKECDHALRPDGLACCSDFAMPS